MISLLKFLDGPWEAVRGYLREDLDHLEAAINQRWGATFDDNNSLLGGTIGGDSTGTTRYIANTGALNVPTWDTVNLANGIQGRLAYSHLVAATAASRLIGRRSGSAGDFEEISVGTGLVMSAGGVLSSTGGMNAAKVATRVACRI
jgi:hypothetical protein